MGTIEDTKQLGLGTVDHMAGWTQLVKVAAPASGGGLTRSVPADTWERLRSVAFQLVTSATVGARQALLTYADGDGAAFAQVPASPVLAASTTQQTFLAPIVPPGGTPGASTAVEGTATAPGAGATIVTTPALPAGFYQVSGVYSLEGTITAAEQDNFQLKVGGTVVEVLQINAVAGTQASFGPITLEVPAATAVLITAVGAGGVAAKYDAAITATPVATTTFYGALPDILLKSGWQVRLDIAGVQAGDQLSGIILQLQRFPSGRAVWVPPREVLDVVNILTGTVS